MEGTIGELITFDNETRFKPRRSTRPSTTGATLDNLSDELVCQDGQWFKPISTEEAFRIRFDVPLFWRNSRGYVEADVCRIENYRNGSHAHIDRPWWSEYPWFVEVDSPDKEEYKPVE